MRFVMERLLWLLYGGGVRRAGLELGDQLGQKGGDGGLDWGAGSGGEHVREMRQMILRCVAWMVRWEVVQVAKAVALGMSGLLSRAWAADLSRPCRPLPLDDGRPLLQGVWGVAGSSPARAGPGHCPAHRGLRPDAAF